MEWKKRSCVVGRYYFRKTHMNEKKHRVWTNNTLKEAKKKTLMCKRPLPHQMKYKTDQVLLPISIVYWTPKNAHTFAIPFLHYLSQLHFEGV
jgi:hypothetical protein